MKGWRVCLAIISLLRRDGEGLRARLEQLGGVWLKVGQMLSTRYDLLPVAVCEALRPLQGRIAGAGGDYARRIVIAELGSLSPFKTFTDEPVAAATIGQVHRAVLTDKRRVAVKVLRVGIREAMASDLRTLRRIAWIVDRITSRLGMTDLIAELSSVMAEELDLRFEADHMRRMRPVLRTHGIRVPKVHRDLSTENVLVTDWIDGAVMSDVLARAHRASWLMTQGTSETEVGKTLLRSLQRQVFETNRFHGDLHPGNVMIRKGKLYAIDFGTTSATERGFLDSFTAFIRALSSRDYARAADLYCLLCVWPSKAWWRRDLGHASVRRRLVRVMADWSARAEIKALPFHAKSINQLSMELMTAIVSSRGRAQWGWLRISRAYSAMEGTVAALWPQVNYLKEMRRYLAQAGRRERWTPMPLATMANILTRWLDRLDEHGRIEQSSLRLDGIIQGL